MSEQDNAVAIAKLQEKIETLVRTVDQINDKVDKIESRANRWTGGFLVLMGLGGLITWLVNVIDKGIKLLP